MKAQPTASHFIAGKYVEDTAGEQFDCIYPATGEIIAQIHSATPAIIELAISSALSAQKEWAGWRPVERGRVLRRAADLIMQRNQELSELETLDTGKPIQETICADATSGAEALEFFGGISTTINGETINLGNDFAYTKRVPLGVCVGIGAWNYPTQIACWKAAPALACGNAMVFKPSETTPLCALKIAEILLEAGAPAGLFNVVQGLGNVGAALTTHPDVAKVSLTGSVPTGKKVYAAAAAGLRNVTMELGGKSPILVFNDADIENAVGGVMLGNFYSAGQVCSNGTRVFVQSGIRDKFIERLVARTKAITLGDPMDEAVQMGPLVSALQQSKVMDLIQIGKDEGATCLTGGQTATVDGFKEGYFVEPTIFSNVTDDMTIARDEIFGPVLSLFDFEDEADAITRANNTEFGLSAGIFTSDLTRAHRVADQLEAGTIWINTYNLAPVEMPFGGSKMSGVGRENSRAALDFYTEIKTIYVGMDAVDSPY